MRETFVQESLLHTRCPSPLLLLLRRRLSHSLVVSQADGERGCGYAVLLVHQFLPASSRPRRRNCDPGLIVASPPLTFGSSSCFASDWTSFRTRKCTSTQKGDRRERLGKKRGCCCICNNRRTGRWRMRNRLGRDFDLISSGERIYGQKRGSLHDVEREGSQPRASCSPASRPAGHASGLSGGWYHMLRISLSLYFSSFSGSASSAARERVSCAFLSDGGYFVVHRRLIPKSGTRHAHTQTQTGRRNSGSRVRE